MNDKTLDYLMHKVESRRASKHDYRDYRGRSDERRDMRDYRRGESRGNVEFEGTMDFRDSEHPKSWEHDERSDYRRGRRDYEDERDMRDYHKGPKLSKTDIHHWKQMMENEDGTHGPHYDMQQIVSAAEKHGIHFEEFDEKEFCIAVNMMYSDYCKVARKYVAPDKELAFFADLAKAFLDDEDGPEASEKLALYFHCIVDA